MSAHGAAVEKLMTVLTDDYREPLSGLLRQLLLNGENAPTDDSA